MKKKKLLVNNKLNYSQISKKVLIILLFFAIIFSSVYTVHAAEKEKNIVIKILEAFFFGAQGNATPTDPLQTNEPLPVDYQQLGLPQPNKSHAEVLKKRLEANEKSRWATKSLLQAEKDVSNKGIYTTYYLTTAWLWFKTGETLWPDPYLINCNNSENSEIGSYCDSSTFEIAGYSASKYNNLFTQMYGLFYSEDQLKTLMQQVIDNSRYASQEKWQYVSSSQSSKTLVKNNLTNGKVPDTISLNVISPNKDFFDKKNQSTQFYSAIIGKDPKIIIALNSLTVNEADLINGLKTESCVYNSICAPQKQLLADMVEALRLFDVTAVGNTLPNPTTINDPNVTPAAGEFVYYPQCNGPYDSLPLPGGCTLCRAGCGLTTASMIIASFADSSFTPASAIDLYKNHKPPYHAGCDGSSIFSAKSAIESKNINTTDFIDMANYNLYSSNNWGLFKNYMNNGWTFFANGTFYASSGACASGCGHFFWIVDTDEYGNVWAYDPYYGSKTLPPPVNLNKYRVYYKKVFGVRP